MVIDDSSSLRRTIALTLEKISDHVLKAENGFKGLEQLQKNKDIELIVCDLEMPQMNGFQFLKAKSQNPKFAQIPVIILTTRDSDKHRRQALELGATAYLTKPYHQAELLETVTGILTNKS
jgi:chemotaxis family two-component system sensor histidine kinase/response regulator PixL